MKGLKQKTLLFSILLAVSYCLTAQVRTNSSLAFEYFNDGEWSKAAPIFKEIYQSNSAKPYLNYYIRCLTELGEFKEAEDELRKAQKNSKDVGLYVDLAYIYELQKDKKKAESYLEKPFKEFPNNINEIRNLGNIYITYRKYDYAFRTYEIGRMILGQPNEFRVEMANLYRMQRMNEKMIEEYLALLLNQPQFLNSVENYLLSSLTSDIDNNLLEITRKKTLEYIQRFPGFPTFTELLIWVYEQENQFEQAVDLAISLDIRSRNSGQQTLQLARKARQAEDYVSSLRAYDYIISQNQPTVQTQENRPLNNPQSPKIIALLESKSTKLEQLEKQKTTDQRNFKELEEEIGKILNDFDNPSQRAMAFKYMSYINMYYLMDYSKGLIQIDSATNLAARDRQLYTDCLLDKADYLLISGDPWNATLLYAQIDKENRESPVGSTAKLRKAQLAFFTEDFSWALSQLNVLKGSSSKLIANDAFELAGLIKNNQNDEDSLKTGLIALSKAHNFRFQRKIDSALLILDSLISSNDDNLSKDDALFMKAEIMIKKGRTEQAIEILNQIINSYKPDMWGHKAIFRLGEIYYQQENFEEALKLFTDLVTNFPNSFYNLDSREYIRKIKELVKVSSPSI